MSEKVFLPSKQFLETMQGGIGSKDFPYGIYGQREIARPEVSAPERHPFNKPEFQPPAKAESAIDEYRRLMGEPGLGDQSSIYKVPPNSPMRMLLA